MAPSPLTHIFQKRENCYYGEDGYEGDCDWYEWGRWVVLGGVILFFLVFFFILSCVTARRRRNRGAQPFYGTGWMAGNHGPVTYNPNGGQGYYNQPPQYQYNQQGYYGQSQGYYGQPPTEMQPPSNTYQPSRGVDEVYAPPAGAPPGKRDVVA